jgi:hypothetical protein
MLILYVSFKLYKYALLQIHKCLYKKTVPSYNMYIFHMGETLLYIM